jgi:hypothetical protein
MTQITIDRALVEQALETIEGLTRDRLFTAEWARVHGATIAALRAVLAQQAGARNLHLASRRRQRLGYLQHLMSTPLQPLKMARPEDNKMSWCCYCGKKLAQELITEGGDD